MEPESAALRRLDVFTAAGREVVVESDAAGVVIYVSPNVREVLGYEREEVIGRMGVSFLLPEDARDLRPLHEERPHDWSGEAYRYRVKRKDGAIRWLESLSRPLLGEDGAPVGRISVARDVTRRVEDEEALRASEARWRSLVENAADYVFTVDRELRITFLNRDAPGRSREAILGRSVFEWYPDADVARARAVYDAVFTRAQPGTYVTPARRADGTLRLFETRVAPILRDGIVTAATAISRDVTDRERLEEAEQALLSQRRLAETILDAQAEMGEAIALMGADGRIVHANRALARITGYSLEELLALKDPIARSATAESAPIWKARFEALARGEPVEPRITTAITRKDGAVLPVEVVGTTVVYQGETCRFYILRDLSYEVAAQRELAAARTALANSDKLAALGTMVSGVAHEARTPMTAMLNASHLLRARIARGQADPALDGPIETIIEGVDRLTGFLEDLRRFTRTTATARAPLSLDVPVRDALRLFTQTHPTARLEARLASTPPVSVNAARVAQVVINLVQNALEASPPGASVRVITSGQPGGGAALAVEDEGSGIGDEIQARIFDPFFTTKSEGTGLGLAIVKRLVEEHGGRITVESARGKGTRFRVAFPPA